jgi:hypothetical protein
LWEVDAAVAEVLLDVTQDVHLLQSDAQRVGVFGCPRVGPAAEHRQAQPADRTGHAPAVTDQLVEVGVAPAQHVGLDAVDQLVEGTQRQRQPPPRPRPR